ncbi:MAG: hypothetical protein QNK05_07780 [Myxococcota bacterium]|nr:hypothetical protein [Myxococcota bacterium]
MHVVVAVWLLAGLVLPPPGTASRDREFCGEWLALSRAAKQQVLEAAALAEPGFDATCRAGRSGPVAHTLDTECTNWPQLMDFEVRAYVDRLLAPCRSSSGSSSAPETK